MDAIADGESAVDLEWIAKPGDVANVRNELLAVAAILILRIEILRLRAVVNAKDFSGIEAINSRLGDRDLANGALEPASDVVPANPTKQDYMTGEVITCNVTR